jgi:aminomethyltransferase
VTGETAAASLSALLTVSVHDMPIGRCRYGLLLNESAGVLDDLVVCRRGEDAWLIVVNAGTRRKDLAWINARLHAGSVLTDVTEQMGKIDVQGPHARGAVERATGADLGDLPYFHARTIRFADAEMLVSRSGYTGEPGFELYPPAAVVVALWRRLAEAGVHPAGLGARDTLRLEAGLPLYGHELGEDVNPVEAGLGRFASKAEPYVGREAVLAARERGPARRLTGLEFSGRRAARHDDSVTADGREVGRVTSGSFAPSLGRAVAMAYVEPEYAVPGTTVCAATARREIPGRTVNLPFYVNPARSRMPCPT